MPVDSTKAIPKLADSSPPSGRRTRGRPPELDLAKIVVAAREQLGDSEEISTLNFRSLAASLGVTAMALYRYVEDKDDPLGHIVDQQLTERGTPREPPDGSWRKWVHEVAMRLFDLITTSPAAAHVFGTRPVVTPAGLRRTEAILRVLCSAGIDRQSALDVYSEVHSYTLGFASIAASRKTRIVNSTRSSQKEWRSFFQSLSAAEYPLLVKLAPDLAQMTSRSQFDRGLTRLLLDLEAELPTRASEPKGSKTASPVTRGRKGANNS